ncbi:hypothetical protein J6590_095211 [Homalodisca vitripennis]|nr:hypothetical protein J6590_095211 [Homalodisca vitripennis]
MNLRNYILKTDLHGTLDTRSAPILGDRILDSKFRNLSEEMQVYNSCSGKRKLFERVQSKNQQTAALKGKWRGSLTATSKKYITIKEIGKRFSVVDESGFCKHLFNNHGQHLKYMGKYIWSGRLREKLKQPKATSISSPEGCIICRCFQPPGDATFCNSL